MDAMATLITTIGTVFTAAVGWMGDVLTFIVAQPLILIPVLLSILGMAISMVRRFVR